MEILTGNMQFTKEVIAFDDNVRKWENKDIIYCYYGYGGWRESILNHETYQFEYQTPPMEWEQNKNYEAKVIEVDENSMIIEINQNGYKFKLWADDFRNEHKYDFDIAI